MRHNYKTPEECDCDKFSTNCPICDGGLAICKVCGGAEGDLTTDCPGERISSDNHDAVYAGKLDYRQGPGWVLKLNPTNQVWERVERICKARDNGVTCYGGYEVREACASCDIGDQCKADSKGATNV